MLWVAALRKCSIALPDTCTNPAYRNVITLPFCCTPVLCIHCTQRWTKTKRILIDRSLSLLRTTNYFAVSKETDISLDVLPTFSLGQSPPDVPLFLTGHMDISLFVVVRMASVFSTIILPLWILSPAFSTFLQSGAEFPSTVRYGTIRRYLPCAQKLTTSHSCELSVPRL